MAEMIVIVAQGGDNPAGDANNPSYLNPNVPRRLHLAGMITARRLTTGRVSGAVRFVVAIDTFLTDLHSFPTLYLELNSVDDTQAEERRGVLLLVAPFIGENFLFVLYCENRIVPLE